jgi:mono/diheme cytochrome c family protein
MTKRAALIVTVATFLFFSAACKSGGTNSSSSATNTSPSSTPDRFAAVRTVYEKDCKGCHGSKGEGGPVKLDDGTKLKVPTFREGRAVQHPDSDYLKQITKGGDGMPAFEKKLTPEQMDDLIKFIRAEFQPAGTSAVK